MACSSVWHGVKHSGGARVVKIRFASRALLPSGPRETSVPCSLRQKLEKLESTTETEGAFSNSRNATWAVTAFRLGRCDYVGKASVSTCGETTLLAGPPAVNAQ